MVKENRNLVKRPRRLRANETVRNLVRETSLAVSDLIYPLFVVEGEGIKREIPSLPDCYHFSVDSLEEEIRELLALGLRSVILFGLPAEKDACGSAAYDDQGVVQRAIRKIKAVCPDFYVITDICMCQYTDHGHCGILSEDGDLLNDETTEYLAKIALSHARAGADMVAPSDMMDGRVQAIRQMLDSHGYIHLPIMSYAAKYCSAYYGPFREAADSAPGKGDRKAYQMDYHNSNEAIREADLDIEEGADIIMVKPALSYMDIIRRFKDRYSMPIAAYNVSGEYAMLKNAVSAGIMREEVIYETLVSIKRAGADIIITYFAKEIAKKY